MTLVNTKYCVLRGAANGSSMYDRVVTENLVLTQHQAHALLLQRTGYQQVWVPIAKKLGLAGWYDSKIAARASKAQLKRVASRYLAECQHDAESLVGMFPTQVNSVMDIGCGLAGVDLALSRIRQSINFVLIDQDRFEEKPHYGFREIASAYNSLTETRNFLSTNGVNESRIRTVDLLTEQFPSEPEVDVVLSIISWGFHYPVETYIDDVYRSLRPGGVAILDIRSGTNGIEVLRSRFGPTAVSEVSSPHSGIPRALAIKQ